MDNLDSDDYTEWMKHFVLTCVMVAGCTNGLEDVDSHKQPAVTPSFSLNPTAELDGQAGDQVAVSGRFAAVVDRSTHTVQNVTLPKAGAVHIYELSANGGTLIKSITAPMPRSQSEFGSSVSLSESATNTVLAIGDPSHGAGGAVFIYEENRGGTGNWGLAAELLGANGSGFGNAVHATDTEVLIGAPGMDFNGVTNAGGAVIVARDAQGQWALSETLPGEAAGELAGWDLGRDGETIALASAGYTDPATQHEGRVLLWKRINGVWTRAGSVVGPNTVSSYGRSVALSGDRLYVAAPNHFDGNERTGIVYIYDVAAQPNFLASVAPPPSQLFPRFGAAISAQSGGVLVGAPGFSNHEIDDGAAFLLTGDGANWRVAGTLSSAATTKDLFGKDVAWGQGAAIVGDPESAASSGRAHVFLFASPNDVDGDGIENVADNCAVDSNPRQLDSDGDGLGDSCDDCANDPMNTDSDGDGICDDADNCPQIDNPQQVDADGDGIGDSCDQCVAGADIDADQVCDSRDNCPTVANASQADADGDGIGDACDECVNDESNSDVDGDGICDGADNCPSVPNQDQADDDANGVGDACEACADRDRDGVCDAVDNCPSLSNSDQIDADNNGVGDACEPICADADDDGVCDADDNCPSTANAEQKDDDNDGVGNACEGKDQPGASGGCTTPRGGSLLLIFALVVAICRRRVDLGARC